MAENKTKPTKVSVAAFIGAIADPTRRTEARALVKLMQNATGERPKMWGPSIIGFGSYHYKYDSGREGDMPLIAFRRASPLPCCITLVPSVARRLCGPNSASTRPARHAFTSRISLKSTNEFWKV
jgi:hypothetical protein